MEDDFGDLFELAPNDGAVDMLQRIFGDIVLVVQGETGEVGDGTILTDLIGIGNQALMWFAIIVFFYTSLSIIFNTAADGQTFGNQANTRYTIIRGLAGGICLIPIKGGFTLIQLILMWLIVQGSALADKAWQVTAENALQNKDLLEFTPPKNEADAQLMGQFANAMQFAVIGELCRLEGNSIYRMTTAQDGSPIERVIASESGSLDNLMPDAEFQRIHFYYSDTSGAFGGSQKMCGELVNSYSQTNAEDIAFLEANSAFRDKVEVSIRRRRFDAANTSVTNIIQPRAAAIADYIMEGGRDDAWVSEKIQDAIYDATASYIDGVVDTSLSVSEVEQLNQELLDEITDQGWAYSVVWYRGVSTAISEASGGSLDSVYFRVSTEMNIDQYFNAVLGSGTSIDSALMSKLKDDFNYLIGFSEYIESFGSFTPNPNATTQASSGEFNIGDKIYGIILKTMSVTNGDSMIPTDPYVNLTDMGGKFSIAGGGMWGAGVAVDFVDDASWFADWIPGWGTLKDKVLSGVSAGLKTVGGALFVAGFIMAAIVPLIPIAYFISAVISWILLCVETMFAVPLAVLTAFAPARESSLIGPWNKVILNIFGIFLRPLFTVIGLVACFMFTRVGLDFIFTIFRGLFDLVNTGFGITTVMIMVGLLMVFCYVTIIVIMHCASLITLLGDMAMHWIGVGFSEFGKMYIGERTADATNVTGRLNTLAKNPMVGYQVGYQKSLKGRETRALPKPNGDNP